MHRFGRLLIGLVVLLMMQAALAAKRLGPPIEELQSTPDRIRIVIAKVKEKQQPNKVLLAVGERLSGEAPDEVLLRTDEAVFADMTASNRYIVAWTYLRRNRGVIGGWEEDPDGPSTVEVMGLGATAVFEDSAELRFLFAPGTLADPATAAQQLDALLAQMQREDFRSRGLVVTELLLRPDLVEVMQPSQAVLLKQMIQDQELDPQHLDYLFRLALGLDPKLSSPWLGEQMRKVIIQHGTQYDLASFVPALVRTAARGLQQAGEPADVDLLGILLYANNPGVAKAALAAMDQLDRGVAISRAQQALERNWIHGETRLALQRFLGEAGS